MTEPAKQHEHHELPFDPNAVYKHTTLEELTAGKEPLKSADQFMIEDLTDEEFDRFLAALEN